MRILLLRILQSFGLFHKSDDAVGKYVRSGQFTAGQNSNTKGMQIDIRSTANSACVRIGDDCQVQGKFFVENDLGHIRIGNRCFIGGGMFVSACGINIGSDVMFSWGCTVIDNDAHSLQWDLRKNDAMDWKKGVDEGNIGAYKNWSHVAMKPVVIKDKAWIGFNSIILKGVTIGEGAVVGAGSVVTRDVEDFTLVAGNPARVIRSLR